MNSKQEEYTLEQFSKDCIFLYNNDKKDFTAEFNGCRILINESSTEESIQDYYYHNVDLSQFNGWSY